jgi:2-oxo-4-hydroxy-4-carboxy-5-ureidoimidazoline decarboxylase
VAMTLAYLNTMDRAGFVDSLGRIFEHSLWVAERAWSHRPFATVAALHAAMVSEVETARPEEQLALLRAHPDLGTRARISEASTAEQAAAGLRRLTAAEFAQLQRLNAAYHEKFGFPFLYAVKGSTKYDILQALERRLANAPDRECEEALRQVYRIAEFRLHDTVQ